MNSEIVVELRVMNFGCHPSEITELFGIQPTLVWEKNELISKIGRGIQRHKENGWAIKLCSKSNDCPLDFHDLFDDVFQKVAQIKERFSLLPNDINIQLACCAYIQGCSPAFSLDESMIKLLAEINASLDFDIYCLDSSE